MNVYKAFSKRPSFDNYDDDWRSFSSVFPYLVENDDNLKLLIDEFDFLNNNWSEIWENVGLQLEEELLWLRYLDSDIPDEKTLIKRICDIAENVLKGGLLNLIENKAASLHLPKEYDFPEDYEIREVQLDQTPDDTIPTSSFKFVEQKFQRFKLDLDSLTDVIREVQKERIQEKPKSEPTVTLVDYFDPVVYDLIQKNPDLLKTMDWRIFEEMLADILRNLGYTIELTRRTKDGGIDVIAIKADHDFGYHKYLLQAKRYSNSVQVSPVRELLFLHREHGASKSCLATTSSFTKGAWELAQRYKWTLELKDRAGILEWIERMNQLKNKSRS